MAEVRKRPAHPSPDIEQALAYVEAMEDFVVVESRQGAVYGRIFFRPRTLEACDQWIAGDPPRPARRARAIRAWADDCIASAQPSETEAPAPPAPRGPEPKAQEHE